MAWKVGEDGEDGKDRVLCEGLIAPMKHAPNINTTNLRPVSGGDGGERAWVMEQWAGG